MESTSTTGLPSQVDPEAVENVVKDTLTSWEAIVSVFLERINELVSKVFNQCFAQYFARYDKSPINKKVHDILRRFFSAASARLHESMSRLCLLETNQVKTANQSDFEKLSKANSIIMATRQRRNLEDKRDAARAEKEGGEAAAEAPVTPAQSRGRKRPRLSVPSPSPDDEEIVDPFDIEAHVLAQVSARSCSTVSS
jgi:hypothetical protein